MRGAHAVALVATLLLRITTIAPLSVVRLQEDGVFSASSRLVLDAGLPRNLRDFTLCVRLNLNYLRGRSNYWLSVANDTQKSLLTGAFVDDRRGARIVLRKFHPSIVDEVFIRFEKGFASIFQAWHHFCFVFQSFPEFPYPGGNVNLSSKAYMDGVFISQAVRVVPKVSYVEIEKGASVVLGQKQQFGSLLESEAALDNFNPESSFSGRIAQLTLWRGELLPDEIRTLAACGVVSKEGGILDWNVAKYHGHDVDVVQVDRESLCRPQIGQGKALFGTGDSYQHYRFFCDKIGGQFPVFNSSADRRAQYNEVSRLMEESFEASNLTCRVNSTLFFWTGLDAADATDVNGTIFVNTYTGKPVTWDVNLWPGPASDDITCTTVRGSENLARERCDSRLPCAVCNFDPGDHRLALKGLCADELKINGDFDTHYYVSGLRNGKVHFRGLRSSHIYFDSLDGRWTLQSLKNPARKSKLSASFSERNFPIGRLRWTVENDNTTQTLGICNLRSGEEHFLSFSDCHPDKFTCTNGECIDLDNKCNSVVDCKDGSDEAECQFLLLNADYDKNKAPLTQNNEPLQVYFSITINGFPEIDYSNLRMKSDYDVNLRWYDPRLRFRDLHNVSNFNALNAPDGAVLWSPSMELVNGVGAAASASGNGNEPRALRLIKEEDQALPEDLSMDREARLFSGATNSISLHRRFSQDHSCKFDFYYYPFDSQVCSLVFELRDKTEDIIHFEPDSAAIKYRGDRSLTQYLVEMESLEISNNELNFSVATVRIVLRHRTEFHVINSFVPTMVVLAVAIATFFFELTDFSDRILVNAVLLLVMATINASIQNHVPVTAYFKLLDVWMLFCFIVIVVTIILHTALAVLFGTGKKRKSWSARSRRDDSDDEDVVARMANLGCMAALSIAVVIFNIAFWVIALKEFNLASQDILKSKPIK